MKNMACNLLSYNELMNLDENLCVNVDGKYFWYLCRKFAEQKNREESLADIFTKYIDFETMLCKINPEINNTLFLMTKKDLLNIIDSLNEQEKMNSFISYTNITLDDFKVINEDVELLYNDYLGETNLKTR